MALTFFAAELRCPVCGSVSKDDTTTNMQNHLSEEPWTVYHVGDAVPAEEEDLRAFLLIRPPASAEVQVLQSWICPNCVTHQWAKVQIAGGLVQSITPVALEQEVLECVHYASDDFAPVYAEITGLPYYLDGKPRSDVAEVLLAALRARQA